MTDTAVYRPGPRSWAELLVCEAKMVIRDTAGLVVPIALPMIILVMNASSAGRAVVAPGRTALDVYVLPLVFTMVLATTGIVNTPSFLAYYRTSGILRRLAMTPASPAMVLVAQLAVGVLQVSVGIAAAWTLAALAFGAKPPPNVGAAIGVLALAALAMYATGMVVAALAPTPNSAVAIGLILFFAVGALGGMFGDRGSLPDALAAIGDRLPFGAAVQALSAVWSGGAVEPAQLLPLLVSVVCGVVIASIFFRWE
ncbi:ABC transporter permease [Spongiactinospora sp. 9N601]|uniref:ABC transporter permease n=1 Tax=Spongiactinospora sp. 9N601 TaxID=3375149 RepID=UPI0037B325F5